MTQVPAIIVGGYLGSGKTTLINAFLRDPGGRRCAVLVNDFGSVNIDADFVSSHDGRTIALSNGCACCKIGDDLIRTTEEVLSDGTLPDAVIIEASGVAQPSRMRDLLLGAANLSPATCLTVVDGTSVATKLNDKFVGRLVRTQIEEAHFASFNRTTEETHRQVARVANNVPTLVNALSDYRLFQPTMTKPTSSAGLAAAELSFKSKTIDFDSPLEIENLMSWLAEHQHGYERIKGSVAIANGVGGQRSVDVNLTPSTPVAEAVSYVDRPALGKLVCIAVAIY